MSETPDTHTASKTHPSAWISASRPQQLFRIDTPFSSAITVHTLQQVEFFRNFDLSDDGCNPKSNAVP